MSEKEYKKMWDNMLKKLNETERYYLAIVNNQKNQEIDRLNNIINELEKDLKKRKDIYTNMNGSMYGVAVDCFIYVLDKLKELKENK